MRKIESTVYTFDELDDKAKDRARDWYRSGALDYEWREDVYCDAENVGLKITGFDLGRDRHAKGKFITSAREVLELNWTDNRASLHALRDKYKLHASAMAWMIKLAHLDALARTSGVETIALGDNSFVDYLNTGDSYSVTLYRWRGRYYVGCWGDLAERHGVGELQAAIVANDYRQH